MTWTTFIGSIAFTLIGGTLVFCLVLLFSGCTSTNQDSTWFAKCNCEDNTFECSRTYEKTKIELEK